MKNIIALIVGKLLVIVLEWMGRGGNLPGEVALKCSPTLANRFVRSGVMIVVTGTNGKTSTANMIADCFRAEGKCVVANGKGDNLWSGIVTTFIKNSTLRYRIKADVMVLEVDELTFAKYLKNLEPDGIVVTNFFRDQLDRAGEMDQVIQKIATALESYEGQLFINADDPHAMRLSATQPITYGVSRNQGSYDDQSLYEAAEGRFCPVCHHRLIYDYYQYSHIGSYRCAHCDFKRPIPTYLAEQVTDSSFVVDGMCVEYPANVGMYYIYNQMATVAVARTYYLSNDAVVNTLSKFELHIGRMERISWFASQTVLLNLVKNPTGCNEIIKYMAKAQAYSEMLFVLNDNDVDGTDISWIWDVNFERLQQIKTIHCVGKRAEEIALRIKYGGLDAKWVIYHSIEDAVAALPLEGAYVLSTYSSLLLTRKQLMQRSKKMSKENDHDH